MLPQFEVRNRKDLMLLNRSIKSLSSSKKMFGIDGTYRDYPDCQDYPAEITQLPRLPSACSSIITPPPGTFSVIGEIREIPKRSLYAVHANFSDARSTRILYRVDLLLS